MEQMLASELIAKCDTCRKGARNICPKNPNELFNTVWLKVREKELSNPDFKLLDPQRYFLRAMRNQMIEWHRSSAQTLEIDKVNENSIVEVGSNNLPGKSFIDEWINEPTTDEGLLFLKNIITLAVNTKKNNTVIKMIGISHRQYYTYKKLAKQRLYDDYYASNSDNLSSLDLV